MFLVLNCLAVLSLEVDILYWLKDLRFLSHCRRDWVSLFYALPIFFVKLLRKIKGEDGTSIEVK